MCDNIIKLGKTVKMVAGALDWNFKKKKKNFDTHVISKCILKAYINHKYYE